MNTASKKKEAARGFLQDRQKILFLFFLAFLFFMSCTGCSSSQSEKSTAAATDHKDVPRDTTPQIYIPAADGRKVIENPLITIDISHTDQGYIMAAYHGDSSDVNIQISGPDSINYMYYISQKDEYTAMPLSSGDGSYLISVYENLEGDMYSTVLSEIIDVTLENEFLPFLYSNQFVNFTKDSEAIQRGAQLAKDCTSDLDVVTAVYNYVTENIQYDFEKASSVTSPYYPDVDETLRTKKGICFDYSALMCTMLRTQGIPTKLNIGYAGDIYHAWISVYIDSMGWVDNIIKFNGTDWTLMDPTFASSAGDDFDPESKDYILMFQR